MKYYLMFSLILFLFGCGKPSEQAPDNSKASEVEVSKVRSCLKSTTIAGWTYSAEYQVVSYSNGDTLNICSISDPSGQFSNTIYGKAGSGVATKGTCLVGRDVDADTGGYWSFHTSDAVYKDSGPNNGTTISFAASDCVEE